MPHYSNTIQVDGAYFDVVVYPPASIFQRHLQQRTVCPSVRVRALIDTGATLSCIDEIEVAQPLKLIARDRKLVGNTAGGTEQFLYDAGFQIPIPGIPILPLQVFGVDMKGQPYKALIGRDLLKFSNFVYSGTSNFWTISF